MTISQKKSSTPMPLARRLVGRAIDLLVIAFVITVGLSVGPQLVEWWRADTDVVSPDLSSLNGTELDWSRSPVTLQYGDASTSIERIPFRGRRDQIQDELTKLGKAIVNSTKAPRSEMEEVERDWLEALRLAPAVFWDSTEGNVYWRPEPLPSFVATRFVERESAGSGDARRTDDPRRTDVEPDGKAEDNSGDSSAQRIVGWGLAFPASAENWTIYVFRPDSARLSDNNARKGIELPNGAVNVTHLRGANGSQWQVFQGRGDLSGWVQHFDDYFGATASTGRTIESQIASLKYRRDNVMTDVQVRREPDGRLTGVIWSAEQGDTR